MVSEAGPFERALGAAFASLPLPLQRFHSVADCSVFQGRVDIEHGKGLVNRCAIALGGFPAPSVDLPLSIRVTRRPDGEEWLRSFGDHQTRSIVRFDEQNDQLTETFGPVRCTLSLSARSQTLAVSTPSTKFIGLKLPRQMSPQSRSSEFSDAPDRLCFDISAFWPNNRLIIRYNGHLVVPDPGTTEV